MAGVLDALASYVTDMLTEMAKEEAALLIGVSDEVDKLGVKLGDLKNFLADADRRNINDISVQVWVEELKRAMYLAADILDLCQLKALENGPPKDMGCLNPLLFCMRNPPHAHDIGSRIKALNEKLDAICTRGRGFNFIKLEAYKYQRTTRNPHISRKTDPLLERSSVVGDKIEEDTRVLVEMLTKDVDHEIDCIMVVAIVGVGGIGKTTLSKKVFNSEAIQGKFSKKIWLSITQEFNEVDLLRTAITASKGNIPGPGVGSEDKALLLPALASAIKDQKFFLVLDDMWGDKEWNNLLKAPFSYGAAGSRVLVTTRHDIIARGMKAVAPYHHVDKLGSEDAWSLLKRQVLTTEKHEPDIEILKDIGLQLIKICDGVPLAIKVMGGLLCQREKEYRAWQKVLSEATWSVSQMPEELNYSMFLSYEDLHTCLRQCFLHFSLKPKKEKILSNEIVGMWIAEGFVHGNSYELEELGYEYYRELILRNLIETDSNSYGQYSCSMHDVVRSFAQFVARDDALIDHKGQNINAKLSSQRFLRLSIDTTGGESGEFEWRILKEQKSLRSIILTGKLKIQSGDSLISFSSLRTLHLEYTNCVALIGSVYLLKHLRYLAVKNCDDITSLPKDIHKMKFLQHISLEGCNNLVELPDSIVKLLGLRFLDLDGTCVISIPRGFCALTSLRALYGFSVHMDGSWCSLEEIGPLSQLREIGLVNLQNVPAASFAKKLKLSEKDYLLLMSLCCSRGTRDDVPEKDDKDKGIIEEVFDELRPPPCIEDIFIYRYFGRQLPTWMMMSAETPFNSLRILSLTDLPYCGQLPDGWSQLPCLDLLEIVHAPGIMRLGIEFVQPYSHRHYASSHTVAGLPRLHKLSLISMVEWDEWDWEERVQAMPSLEELYIRTCKLRCIPPGLAFHARSLKKLTIWSAKGVSSLENFASVVDLDLFDIPCLTMISNFPKLQKLEIKYCPNLESLEEMNALRRLVLELVYKQERLPLFLQTIKPSHLQLNCRLASLASMAAGKSGAEWENFSHIQNVEAYSNLETGDNRWHVFYTREPYSMKTNIDLQSLKRYCAGYEDRSEEEWMCHDPTVTLEEIEEE
ncbi:unnamed protein product [Alopecurus aequalis]